MRLGRFAKRGGTSDSIFQDWEVNHGNFRIQLLLVMFRFGSRQDVGRRCGWRFVHKAYRLCYRFVSEWVFGIEIPLTVRVGPRLTIRHGYGLVVHSATRLGSDCILRQGVTLGIRTSGPGVNAPVIGNGVDFGSGSQVLGQIQIGDRVRVGAGSVVLVSVPAKSTVVGNPARVVAKTAPN